MQPKDLETADTCRNTITDRTRCAISELTARGERVSFYSVAKQAHVARSTLYRRNDLRKLVEGARGSAALPAPSAAVMSRAELEDRLARVTRERDALQRALRNAKRNEYALMRIPGAA